MKLVDVEQIYCSDCEHKGHCENVTCDIKTMPTVDPVVSAGGCYCRECRWGQMDDISTMHCHKYHTHKQPDGFCSDGQRKEAAHEVSQP